MHTTTKWLVATLTLLALACVPNPPEAEPPEVEVSGGELPEYENHEADVVDEDDDDSLSLDLDLDLDDDFDAADRHIDG